MQKSPMFGKGMVWAWIALCVGFASGHILARADRVQSRVLLERMRNEFEALNTCPTTHRMCPSARVPIS